MVKLLHYVSQWFFVNFKQFLLEPRRGEISVEER